MLDRVIVVILDTLGLPVGGAIHDGSRTVVYLDGTVGFVAWSTRADFNRVWK